VPRVSIDVRWCVVGGLVLGVGCSTPLARQERVAASPPPAEVAEPLDEAPAAEPLLDDARIDWKSNGVMRVVGRISETMTSTEYSRGMRVDERKGIYAFDCSGMVDWILQKSAPLARSSSAAGLEHRPLAVDFYRRISKAPVDREHGGWRQVARLEEARPGDVIAWIKPPIIPSPNTGHVAVIVQGPVRVPGRDDAFLVRVADSTSLLHQDDTRAGRNGFGFGTILVMTDAAGAPARYGWVGLRGWTFETPIAIGRPTR
jgi:hypothetical protein